jgi:uncharacterized protein YceH (UPF0502 family)
MLRALMEREDPLVKQLPPSPGSRAERFMQLLCPTAHPVDAPVIGAQPAAAPQSSSGGLGDRVAALEQEVVMLRGAVQSIAQQLGIADPTGREKPGRE